MSIHTVINVAEAEKVVWDGFERRGKRNGERFPWEQGSPGERLRGRIVGLIAGILITALVGIANPEPIGRIERQAEHLASLFDLPAAKAAAPQIVQPKAKVAAAKVVGTAGRRPTKSLETAAPETASPVTSPPRVQLGSYLSRSAAETASAMMSQSYQPVLGTRELHISQALVQDEEYFRVAIHAQSDAEAYALCDTIKMQSIDCFVWPARTAEEV